MREESKLRLEEEQAKRSENMGGYNNTMTDLSNLLETHTAQNSRLRDQNAQMASKMGELVAENISVQIFTLETRALELRASCL